MAMVVVMKKPSSKSRISARTAPEIVSLVKLAVVRMAGKGLLFRKRKLGIEGFLGSVMLEILDRSDEELKAILDRRLSEVEAYFDAEEVGSGTPRDEREEGSRPGDHVVVNDPEEPFRKLKRSGRKPKQA